MRDLSVARIDFSRRRVESVGSLSLSAVPGPHQHLRHFLRLVIQKLYTLQRKYFSTASPRFHQLRVESRINPEQ